MKKNLGILIQLAIVLGMFCGCAGSCPVSELSTANASEACYFLVEGELYHNEKPVDKHSTELVLDGCHLDSFEFLRDFTELTRLDLVGTNISDLSILKSLPNLKYLHISCCENITDVSVVGELDSLIELVLTELPVSDISQLEKLNLKRLSLYFMSNIKNIDVIRQMTTLESLSLWGTGVNDITALENLKELRYLELAHTPITDISSIKGLIKLEVLNLIECSQPVDLTPLSGLINMRELDLPPCESFDLSIIKEMKGLESFGATAVETPFDDITVLAEMERLSSIRLWWVTGEQMVWLDKHFPNANIIASVIEE